MPQKTIFSRAPILTASYCFPAAGTVRTSDRRVSDLYHKAEQFAEQPYLWEGLFRLSCLIKSNPLDEAVTDLIRHAIGDTENGAFAGGFYDQICTARAAFALFEYNTDRLILKRLAKWFRYVEIEFDGLAIQDHILYRPADLMELLVRFYLASGAKSALRICARLRADAFDWTTALHTFQQTIPVGRNNGKVEFSFPDGKPDEIEYDEKEKLINHAETLADGARYTLFAGMYSGHGQDLTAGKALWKHLIKHHHALCGGSTGSPYLCGNTASRPVDNVVPAAWTEAFASMLIIQESEWALDEIIRIIFNALDECLNRPEKKSQQINSVNPSEGLPDNQAHHYARLTRAVAAAYHHAVALTESGIRINYPIAGRYLLMSKKQPFMLTMDPDEIVFQCMKPVSVPVDFYLSPFSTCRITVDREVSRSSVPDRMHEEGVSGLMIHMDTEWHDRNRIRIIYDDRIICEDTHHQGRAFLASNRLLCMPAEPETFARAVCSDPEKNEKEINVFTAAVGKWEIKDGQPGDIPVLPEIREQALPTKMGYYSDNACRIAMFPRAKN